VEWNWSLAGVALEDIMGFLNAPTLGIRFNIQKLEEHVGKGSYGQSAWIVFWRVFHPTAFHGAVLYEGDTQLTLDGGENCYCIAVQAMSAPAFHEMMNHLQMSKEYLTVCADPQFIRDDVARREPLVLAGMLDSEGKIICPPGVSVSSHLLGGLKVARPNNAATS
jgi:hypothetical protein